MWAFALSLALSAGAMPLAPPAGRWTTFWTRVLTPVRGTERLAADLARANAELVDAHRGHYAGFLEDREHYRARVIRLADAGRRALTALLGRQNVPFEVLKVPLGKYVVPVVVMAARNVIETPRLAQLRALDPHFLDSLRFGYAPEYLILTNHRGLFLPRYGLVLGAIGDGPVTLDAVTMHELVHYLLHFALYHGREQALHAYFERAGGLFSFPLRDETYLHASEILAYAVSNLEVAARPAAGGFPAMLRDTSGYFAEIDDDLRHHLRAARDVAGRVEHWEFKVIRVALAGEREVVYRVFVGTAAVYVPLPRALTEAYVVPGDRTDDDERPLNFEMRRRLVHDHAAEIAKILNARLDALGATVEAGLAYYRTLETADADVALERTRAFLRRECEGLLRIGSAFE